MWWAMWSEGEGVRVGGLLWGWGTRGLQLQSRLQVRLLQHMHLPAVAGLCSFFPFSCCVEATRCYTCIDGIHRDQRHQEKRSDAHCFFWERCAVVNVIPKAGMSGRRKELRVQQTADRWQMT